MTVAQFDLAPWNHRTSQSLTTCRDLQGDQQRKPDPDGSHTEKCWWRKVPRGPAPVETARRCRSLETCLHPWDLCPHFGVQSTDCSKGEARGSSDYVLFWCFVCLGVWSCFCLTVKTGCIHPVQVTRLYVDKNISDHMQMVPVLQYCSWVLEDSAMCFKSWNISREKRIIAKHITSTSVLIWNFMCFQIYNRI